MTSERPYMPVLGNVDELKCLLSRWFVSKISHAAWWWQRGVAFVPSSY